MVGYGSTTFETAVGRCGVVWGEDGIVGVQLPERSPAATTARQRGRWPAARPGEPPPAVAKAIADMTALLEGEDVDLGHVEVDLKHVPEFHRRVYELARAIPRGETLTYGEVATRLGEPGAARAVGQALGRNPVPIVVPCHRVVAASGLGGFSAEGGAATKARMLSIEGAAACPPTLFDADGPR